MVGIEEQGLVERLGVPVGGPAAARRASPALALADRQGVSHSRCGACRRSRSATRARRQADPKTCFGPSSTPPTNTRLLLGNGRDLITVDAAVQYRITDARAWRYHCQNPADALRAIAYRAVMRSTVNRTLSEALSENVATLTARDARHGAAGCRRLGLGVEVLAFTVGGMHPPVPVAPDYEAVVSAELGKVTAVVNAQAFRNQTVPAAEASVVADENTARAEGAEALARAAGEAGAFARWNRSIAPRPQEYFFRRRLETLEKGLGRPRRFTVVDSRFQRDGGELWLTP